VGPLLEWKSVQQVGGDPTSCARPRVNDSLSTRTSLVRIISSTTYATKLFEYVGLKARCVQQRKLVRN